ncbi:MAG: helix-hairpin-helix domain-containing protein [Myxococcota bacterium]|nr:helix-hairpin-helix domain-containing protein [Deltaproteobacteria bacterium]MDQ3337697.1 helix-hairpin-helix domain-containing protein [Myxococcota bacterium]
MKTHFKRLLAEVSYRALHILAIIALILSMGGTWMLAKDANAAPGKAAAATPATPAALGTTKPGTTTDDDLIRPRPSKKDVTGRLNLNTATEEQLMLLPTVGPSKAERVVTWRKKNGGFKRTADLRRVKGFGYKTFKRLEPFLDIKGDTTLVAARR